MFDELWLMSFCASFNKFIYRRLFQPRFQGNFPWLWKPPKPGKSALGQGCIFSPEMATSDVRKRCHSCPFWKTFLQHKFEASSADDVLLISPQQFHTLSQ